MSSIQQGEYFKRIYYKNILKINVVLFIEEDNMFDFFTKKRNLKEESKDLLKEKKLETIQEENENSIFALYLLFPQGFIIDKEIIAQRISKISNEAVQIDPILDLDGKDSYLYCDITIGNEKFNLVGIDTSIPQEVYDYTINCAYGSKEDLDVMRQHNYHIIAYYKGKSTDQNVIYNSYEKLAYGFIEHDLVGMANNYSWNALTPNVIKGLVEDDRMTEMASTPAFMIWRNFVKIPHNDKIWFVTKGNNLYGIYEYAFYGTFEDSQEVYDMFEDIFNYEYSTKAMIISGNTMEIGEDVYLKFREVYELEDVLQGDGIGTLVIEKINSAETNR